VNIVDTINIIIIISIIIDDYMIILINIIIINVLSFDYYYCSQLVVTIAVTFLFLLPLWLLPLMKKKSTGV